MKTSSIVLSTLVFAAVNKTLLQPNYNNDPRHPKGPGEIPEPDENPEIEPDMPEEDPYKPPKGPDVEPDHEPEMPGEPSLPEVPVNSPPVVLKVI